MSCQRNLRAFLRMWQNVTFLTQKMEKCGKTCQWLMLTYITYDDIFYKGSLFIIKNYTRSVDSDERNEIDRIRN